jgi:hypothetical protein
MLAEKHNQFQLETKRCQELLLLVFFCTEKNLRALGSKDFLKSKQKSLKATAELDMKENSVQSAFMFY